MRPLERYELIYNENINKFVLGGNLTLFDITLNEPVSQIDLNGITNMLKEGKLYALIVYLNNATSEISSAPVYFGTTPVMNISSTGSWFYCSPFLFTIFKNGNNVYICGNVGSNSYSNAYTQCSLLTSNEYIKSNSSNYPAGTRFIIKEVA